MTPEEQTPGVPPGRDREKDAADDAVILSDPKAIRALAHGVRLQVIEELFDSDDSFTATELGRKFGLTPSAMSYHLRSLERWGLVRRAEGHGDGRERHWRSAGSHLTIDTSEASSNPAALGFVDMQINQLRERMSKHLSRQGESLHGQSLQEARRLPATNQGSVWLTAEQRAEVADQIWELLSRFRHTSAESAVADSRAAGGDGSDIEKIDYYLSFVPDPDAQAPVEG